jgi:WD40 repeat protein
MAVLANHCTILGPGLLRGCTQPDGQLAATSYQSFNDATSRWGPNVIRVWDVKTGELLAELTGHSGQIIALRFISDGTRLISGATDGTLQLWGVSANWAIF